MRIILSLSAFAWSVVTGSCTEDERSIWRDNTEFSKRMDTYARQALGNGAHVTAKLLEDYHPMLSLGCAACHGGTVSCGTKNCWIHCLFSSSTLGCQECTRRECLASYMSCIGTESESDLPPKPVDAARTTTVRPPIRTRVARSTSTTLPPSESSTESVESATELVIP